MSLAYQRIDYHGVILNRRTAQMTDAAQERFGRPFGSFPQGSYRPATKYSATTHCGGGALDVFDEDLEGVCHAMKAVGFASWHRPYVPNLWDEHCHNIAIGDLEMSNEAHDQVIAYYNRQSGLVGEAHDGTWRPNPIPVWNYQPGGLITPQDTPWDAGDVYVEKLHLGQNNSDSVKRLQYRLQVHKTAGTKHIGIDGDFGDQTRWALRKWQDKCADLDPKDGRSMPNWQAHRLFSSDSYNVHETT
jgi:hypothetical protein